MRRNLWQRTAFVFVCALFALGACSNPAGGSGGKETVPVSGSIDPTFFEGIGRTETGTAAIEFRDSQGRTVGSAAIAGNGAWAVKLPQEYADTTLHGFLVVSDPDNANPEDRERIFDCGTITIDADGNPGVSLALPDTTTDYDITAAPSSEHGDYTVSRTGGLAGEVITITADPAPDYHAKPLVKNGEDEIPLLKTADNTWIFTMPAEDVTVTVAFDTLAAVDAFSLDELITAPLKGGMPQTGISHTQYTGTIAWQTEGGAAHSGPFAPDTVYRAVVTLSANTGFTFTGVAAGSFTYELVALRA
jgi:hypothetical protein